MLEHKRADGVSVCGSSGRGGGEGCPVIQFQMELTLIKQPHGAIKSLDVKK